MEILVKVSNIPTSVSKISHFSHQDIYSMNQTIDEKVSVLSLYDQQKGEVVPVEIKWKTRTYSVNQVGMHYTQREGRDLHHIFCVTSGALAFKLNLSTENLHWVLEEISDGLTS